MWSCSHESSSFSLPPNDELEIRKKNHLYPRGCSEPNGMVLCFPALCPHHFASRVPIPWTVILSTKALAYLSPSNLQEEYQSKEGMCRRGPQTILVAPCPHFAGVPLSLPSCWLSVPLVSVPRACLLSLRQRHLTGWVSPLVNIELSRVLTRCFTK